MAPTTPPSAVLRRTELADRTYYLAGTGYDAHVHGMRTGDTTLSLYRWKSDAARRQDGKNITLNAEGGSFNLYQHLTPAQARLLAHALLAAATDADRDTGTPPTPADFADSTWPAMADEEMA
ncbi:hypothetical protein [Macromonas nakdongensis]|uniref:hypothetical protein n=1 Tax=Macromonas nakdongensis TaxID=1843082 RepID=UPI000C3240EE|nr:hypothetical protein [Macromonas nakdongensis]